jgi:hypothetical protein
MKFTNFLFFKQINKEKADPFFTQIFMEKIRRFIGANRPE